ncbi:MAG: DinB family protein [Thermoplasmata archaeon]|nr:DinB family protein [Thermoplasmata archaeon]
MGLALGFPLDDARAIVAYNRAVFDRFVRKVRKLPGNDATRRRGIGHESLFGTLVHILNVQEVWLVYIARGRNTDKELGVLFDDPSRHPKDWAGFDAYAQRVWSEVDLTVRGLKPGGLNRPIKAFWMTGTYTVRDGFLRATFEEAHHLGEIIGALWQKDVEPPAMTWIEVRRRPAPTRSRGKAAP